MRRLTLLSHLRRRSFDLQEEWLKAAGIAYLLEQGWTRSDVTTSVLPESMVRNPERELELRKGEVERLRKNIEEVEATIQELADHGQPSDVVELYRAHVT